MAISLPHALAAGRLPGPHKDPFDRMLIAQAQLEGFTVVTSDPVFQRYRVPVVW
ncbi:MAG: type II toxin-antitoxin system VapC family toxin [Gammaproteobacteria bacterium]